VTQVMAELPAVVEALTGKSFEELAKHIPGVAKPLPAHSAKPSASGLGDAEEIK
jgi:hypothetical protein